MDAAVLIRRARSQAQLSLRQLAARAHTSHSALAAYESGRTVPTVAVLERVLRAAGFATDVTLTPRADRHHEDRTGRGDELVEVLRLAEMFPARCEANMSFPRFGAA